MSSPALPKATASDGLKLGGSEWGDDHVRDEGLVHVDRGPCEPGVMSRIRHHAPIDEAVLGIDEVDVSRRIAVGWVEQRSDLNGLRPGTAAVPGAGDEIPALARHRLDAVGE